MPKKQKKKSKFRHRLPLAGIFLLLMIGICFFMYPIVGSWYTDYCAREVIRDYDKTVQSLDNDTLQQLQNDAFNYNKALEKKQNPKISSLNYNDMLKVASAIGYIEIPKIDVHSPIYHGLSEDVLKKGIGHMEGSSLPVGGSGTHCVLAGHTGLPTSKLFTDLDTLTTGDVFYIHVLDKVLKYQIDQILTVLPFEDDEIRIVEGEDYVTLVTCTPYGINSHRLLVRGSRVPYETKEMKSEKVWPLVHAEENRPIPARNILWYIATGVVVFVLVGIVLILAFPSFRGKKKKVKNTVEGDSSDDNSQPQ